MAHIFISYSKQNRDYARRLADDLLARGFDVWIDDRIEYSEDWWQSIDRAIRSSGACIVIMSPESEQSRWVQRELTLADNEGKPTFPLWLAGDNPMKSGQWSIFSRTQFADVRGSTLPNERFYEQLEKVVSPRVDITGKDRSIEPEEEAKPEARTANRRISVRIGLIAVFLFAAVVVVIISFAKNFDSAMATPTILVPTSTPIGGGRGEIAFEWRDNASDTSDIYTMDANGVILRRLTTDPYDNELPVWSPDGQKIAFLTYANQHESLHLLDADGANSRLINDTQPPGQELVWSPNGRQIAFTSDYNGDGTLFTVDVDDSTIHRLTQATKFTWSPTWSPDSMQIAFVAEMDAKPGLTDVYVVNSDGTNLRDITNSASAKASPMWSPVGQQIAFSAEVEGDKDIYIVDSDGTNLRKVTQNTIGNDSPTWSPDGSEIAFFAIEDNDSGYYSELYVMHPDGTNLRRLTSDSALYTYPSWSPDGKQIAFNSISNGFTSSATYVINVDGTNLRRLPSSELYAPRSWRP